VQLVGLRVTDDAPVAGRTLADIGSEYKDGSMLTVALTRNGTTIVPTGDTEIQSGDLVYFVVTDKVVPQGLELCGYHQSEVRRVMIAGGSLEAYYLAGFLNQHRAQVIMLVKEKERARELAEKLNQALVLNGDATDVELLEMEGVAGVDGFVALTDHDERNILAAVLARHAGAKQVVTLVNKTDYVSLATRIGLDAIVSPRLSAANAILRYVRRGTVTSVATFKDSDAEAISFHVSSTSPLVGSRLADIEFPDGAIVAAIVRSSATDPIIPGGDDKLAAGDSVIVFALPTAVGPVTDLFPS
jgi:trk system potassium uptake protein TrkA